MYWQAAYKLIWILWMILLMGGGGKLKGQAAYFNPDSLLTVIHSEVDDSTKAMAAFTLSSGVLMLTDPDSGLRLTYHWVEVCKSKQLELPYVIGLNTLVNNYYSQGLYDSALAIGDRLIAYPHLDKYLSKEQNIPAMVWGNRGAILEILGDMPSANEATLKALSYSEAVQDTYGILVSLTTLAAIRDQMEDYEANKNYLKRSLSLAQAINLTYEEGFILSQLALSYQHEEQWDSAIYAFHRSNGIFRRLGTTYDLCIGYTGLGNYYLGKDQIDSAAFYLRVARDLAETLNNDDFRVMTLNHLAKLAAKQQTWALGERYLDTSFALIAANPNPNSWMKYYQVKADFLSERGAHAAAFDALNEMTAWKDTMLNAEKVSAVERWKVRYETTQKENEILTLSQKTLQQEIDLQTRDQLIGRLALGLTLIIAVGIMGWMLMRQRQRLKEQRSVFHAIAETEIAEQSRIARDLHDGMGSLLATIARRVAPHAQVSTEEEETYQLVRQAGEEMRRISHNLMPTDLLKYGLETALGSLVDRFATSDLQTKFTTFGSLSELPVIVQLQTYRIVQELVQNTAKHAQASELFVQLTRHDNHLNVLVEDNGQGFDIETAQEGLGLQSLRTRTQLLNGSFFLDSHPDSGTTVSLDIPLLEGK